MTASASHGATVLRGLSDDPRLLAPRPVRGGRGESCTDDLAAGLRDRRSRQFAIDAVLLSEPTQ